MVINKRAAVKLKQSIRQIDRMIAGYKDFGKEFLYTEIVVENQKKPFTEDFKTEIELLYTSKYFDCTYTDFKEYLETREKHKNICRRSKSNPERYIYFLSSNS